jgi:phospholipid N-methyltransferase
MSLRTFTPEALKDLHTTASLVPSSRFLTQAMLAPLPLARARCVVEFGPGTGVMTRPLLKALPAEATLLCFEVNPRFCAYLKENLFDPRLEVIAASAERLPEELAARGLPAVDAAISSLGLTTMPGRTRDAILRGLICALGPNAVFTQFQYLHSLLVYLQPADGHLERFTAARFLRRYFSHLTIEVVWRNIPPAFVLTCRR